MANFVKTEKQSRFLSTLQELTPAFSKRAFENDRTGTFPFENLEDLKKAGYTKKPLEDDFSLYDFVLFQEQVAYGDGATALAVGWHVGLAFDLIRHKDWKKESLDFFIDQLHQNKIFNYVATEKKTGSPARGGRPATTARRSGDGWIVDGEKSFATMAPALDYFVITASIEGTDDTGNFLIPADAPGVSIKETWDSIAMKATASHDVVFDNVSVPGYGFAERVGKTTKKTKEWYLNVPAVYLGISRAARDEAIRFAKSYVPNSVTEPIASLPNVREKIGEIEALLLQSQYVLFSVAEKFDEANEEERWKLVPDLSFAKYVVTNGALKIIDKAMRIVGAHSLRESSPLARYYRDVRAGLYNPPPDDVILKTLAEKALSPKSETLAK